MLDASTLNNIQHFESQLQMHWKWTTDGSVAVDAHGIARKKAAAGRHCSSVPQNLKRPLYSR